MQRKMLSCDVVSVEAPADPMGSADTRLTSELSQVGQHGKLICHCIWSPWEGREHGQGGCLHLRPSLK